MGSHDVPGDFHVDTDGHATSIPGSASSPTDLSRLRYGMVQDDLMLVNRTVRRMHRRS